MGFLQIIFWFIMKKFFVTHIFAQISQDITILYFILTDTQLAWDIRHLLVILNFILTYTQLNWDIRHLLAISGLHKATLKGWCVEPYLKIESSHTCVAI